MDRSSKVLKFGSSKVWVTAQKPSSVSSVPLCETIREEISDISKNCKLKTTNFLWDNWNIISEQTTDHQSLTTNSVSYVWGIDLSGSLQDAGGVGGLLAVVREDGVFHPTYDANGNVSEYIDSTGNIVAHYEYDAFGNTVVQHGVLADSFSFRFSTKPYCTHIGFVHYELRPYSPFLGRWVSWDPIKERGGLNMYGFVANDMVNGWDKLGLFKDGGEVCLEYFEWWVEFPWIDTRYSPPRLMPGKKERGHCRRWNRGHKDFSNDKDNCFDWTKEDYGKSSPYKLKPWFTRTHFQDFFPSLSDVHAAIRSCDVDAFSRHMHRLQDYFTHRGKGYGRYLLLRGVHPNNPSIDIDENAWEVAEEWTKGMLETWHDLCELKPCGKPCEYYRPTIIRSR